MDYANDCLLLFLLQFIKGVQVIKICDASYILLCLLFQTTQLNSVLVINCYKASHPTWVAEDFAHSFVHQDFEKLWLGGVSLIHCGLS